MPSLPLCSLTRYGTATAPASPVRAQRAVCVCSGQLRRIRVFCARHISLNMRAPPHNPPPLRSSHAELPPDTPADVHSLLTEAWDPQQGKRPSMAAIVERLQKALHTMASS